MFEEYYGFTSIPFTRNLPVNRLFTTPQQEEVLARLAYAAERRWFAVLTGDCGSGKSTLIRKLTNKLDSSGYRTLYLADSQLTPRHFYNGILRQLGAEGCFYRGDAKRRLHREIEVLQSIQHVKPVVIVDEAHLLDRETMEELRFLLNFKIDSDSPMALILVGQPELTDKLRRQAYLAIEQRVNLKCYNPYLDEAQTKAYILHHLNFAKSQSEIFSDQAISEIFRYSAGSARLINKACTHCLMYGSQQNKKILDDALARYVIEQELI